MITATHPGPEELMAYADGETSSEPKESVAQHLEECAECRQAVAKFEGDTKVLRSWSVEPMSVGVEGTIWPETARYSLTTAPRRLPTWSKWALGLGLGAAAVFFLIQRPKPQPAKTHAISVQPLDIRPWAAPPSPPPRSSTDAKGVFHSLADPVQNSFSVDGEQTPDHRLAAEPTIARIVSLTLVVKDFAAARAEVDAILARHHSYAAQLTANTAEGAPRTLQASLRVRAPELAATLAELKLLGRVENESQSGEEVTQQHADLLARLNNARETEQRLQAILQQRTGKISDVLAVEQEIARVRGEIEEMEAEQKSLEHRVEFATVELRLAGEYKAQLVIPPLSVGPRLHNAVVEGYRNVGETLLGIAVFFAEYGPMLLIWALWLGAPVFLVWRRYRRTLAAV